MKQVEISIAGIDQLPVLARTILDEASRNKVFAFYGDMGSGKTTLIKELCRRLGSGDNLSSPTYAVVNEYNSTSGRIYHMDLYRLDTIHEAIDIGIEDYLEGKAFCFIEWPELVEDLLPANVTRVHLKADGDLRNVSIFTNH